MSHRAVKLARAAALAVVVALLGGADAAPDAVSVVQKARAMAAAGQGDAAAQLLERFLTRSGGSLGLPDVAMLRLEAARSAVGDPVLAGRNLNQADRAIIGVTGRLPAPILARLQRESARQHERLGDLAAADRQLAAALAGFGTANPTDVAEAANARGLIQLEQSQPSAAAGSFQRSLRLLGCVAATAPGPACAAVFANLANALATANELPAAQAAADDAERAAGTDPRSVRTATLAKAEVLMRGPDPDAAEQVLASVAGLAAGQDEMLRGFALYLTASARLDRGLLPEAAQTALLADIAYRNGLGDQHPARARVLHLLAVIATDLGDNDGAARYFDQADAMAQRSFGPNSMQAATLGLERIRIDLRRADLVAAKARLQAASDALARAADPDPVMQARTQIAAGLIAEAERQPAAAAAAFLAARILLDGPAHRTLSPDMGFTLLHLGRAQAALDRFAEAGASFSRDVAVQERFGASATTWKAEALVAQASLLQSQGDLQAALQQGRASVQALRQQIGLGSLALGTVRDEARDVLATHARIALAARGPEAGLDEAFASAQLAFASRAGDAVRLTASRLAVRSDGLAALLREQEELSNRLRQAETLLRAALLRTGPGVPVEEQRLEQLRGRLRAELEAKQTRLAAEYPRFTRFAEATPVQVSELQAVLAADEALLMPFDTSAGTLLFVVTRDGARALSTGLTHPQAASLVTRLRAGLDLGEMQLTGRVVNFDVPASEELYRAIVGPAEPLLEGKRRLVVIASGALQTFPPAVLQDPVRHEWLIRRFALSTFPSPAALVASRTSDAGAAQPAGPDTFLGIGDPDFRPAPNQLRGLTLAPELRQAILQLPRLPETRDELLRMARLYSPESSRVLLGRDATRSALASNRPDEFRTVVFATHAAMAGELPGLLEPVIFLTPLNDGAEDSGMLAASEIAAMDIQADLVLLSACNTAAPDGGPLAEGLSGLVRAFFQAGAHTLLVSHWAVNSVATARLTTDFLTRLRAAPATSKPDALRAAMLDMLDGADLELRHPAFWAPFVIVGN